MIVNRLRLIRQAKHVLKTTGDKEKAYTIISHAFGKEHGIDGMLDYQTAKKKLDEDSRD